MRTLRNANRARRDRGQERRGAGLTVVHCLLPIRFGLQRDEVLGAKWTPTPPIKPGDGQ